MKENLLASLSELYKEELSLKAVASEKKKGEDGGKLNASMDRDHGAAVVPCPVVSPVGSIKDKLLTPTSKGEGLWAILLFLVLPDHNSVAMFSSLSVELGPWPHGYFPS